MMSRAIIFEDGAPFARMNAMALVGMSGAGKTMSDEERHRAVDAIASESAPVLAAYSEGPRLKFELRANLAIARMEV
jgi:hypothetical protein